MQVTVHKDKVFDLLDVLVSRLKAKQYPYNRPDARIPQEIIPEEIRRDKRTLACFYFYVCIYMRGGIESMQAFAALIKMWRSHPALFDPLQAQWFSEHEVQVFLKKFIGWDSKTAARHWVTNSRLLAGTWGANPLNLIKNVDSYEEACRRIRNKQSKRDKHNSNSDGHGFLGFQYKMVSMLIYFYDWEGWLKPRFIYPSPADFHNFRLGFSIGAIEVHGIKDEMLTINERISKPWREAITEYIRARKADPLIVSDALWLYSLSLCGNSPYTVTSDIKLAESPLFKHGEVAEQWTNHEWIISSRGKQLLQTCAVCVLESKCMLAIPSRPYYRKGKFVLRKRPRLDVTLDPKLLREPKPSEVLVPEAVLDL